MAVDNRTANRNYPLPDPTNNLDEDVYRLVDAFNGVDGDMKTIFDTLPTKSNVGHGHQIADISGLQSALDGKAAAGHTHALNDLSDVNVSGAANGQFLKRVSEGWLPAGLTIEDVASLQTALNARAMLDGSSVVVPAGTSSQRPASPTGPRFRFNTTLGEFEGWNGTEWGLIGGSGEALRDTFTYTAAGGETSVAVTGGYAPDQGIVFLNGVALDPFTEVNISSGANIIFASPLAAGDAVVFIRFRAFDVATAVLFVSQILSEGQKTQARQNIGLGDILASLRYMGSIGSAEDLDTYTAPGIYTQNQNAGAASGSNYPAPTAGLLEVLDGVASNVKTVQRYTLYSTGRLYWRIGTASAWSAWKEAVTPDMLPAQSNKRIYLSSATWTKPEGLTKVVVTCLGGGGGSGGTTRASDYRGGGGAGGTMAVSTIMASSLGSTEPITVGAGGSAGSSAGGAGGAGGNSSFGSHCIGNGGGGGGGSQSNTIGAGGTPGSGTGDLVIRGMKGAGGGDVGYFGLYGASPICPPRGDQSAPLPNANTGLGAIITGANGAGLPGMSGLVIIEEYF